MHHSTSSALATNRSSPLALGSVTSVPASLATGIASKTCVADGGEAASRSSRLVSSMSLVKSFLAKALTVLLMVLLSSANISPRVLLATSSLPAMHRQFSIPSLISLITLWRGATGSPSVLVNSSSSSSSSEESSSAVIEVVASAAAIADVPEPPPFSGAADFSTSVSARRLSRACT